MKILASATLALVLLIEVIACATSHAAAAAHSFATASQAVNAPAAAGPSALALPAVFLDTTYPQATGRTLAVPGGANGAEALPAAIDKAAPGDVIVLDAGAQFVGNFTIPAKPDAGGKWLIVRSSAESKLTAGARVAPADAAAMPKLVSPNADAALKTAPGAHHVR